MTGDGNSMRNRVPIGPGLVALAVASVLVVFLVLPVGTVILSAFGTGAEPLTLAHFSQFFSRSLLREAFFNSVAVSLLTVLFCSLIAVPLAYLAARFEFRGAILIEMLGVLPLIMPPFVGAVALQMIFGVNGSVNLLLDQWFGWKQPLMNGLTGVVLVESIHYFPFILLNLTVALRNIDGAMEEAALSLRAGNWRLFRRVVFPLALPGYVAGAALVFIKVFDDLGTPLVMGVTNMLAPQAYLRITSVGLDDPLGYVISFIMIGFSIVPLWASTRFVKLRDYAMTQRSGHALRRRRLGKSAAWLAYGWIALVLALVLAPHLGVVLLSLGSVWSYAVLPDAFTLQHYGTVIAEAGDMMFNTILYCGLAALIDIVLGCAIAYLILRTRLPGRGWLEFGASAALTVPGVVLAIGYLRFFKDMTIPFTDIAFTQTWVLIMIAYAVRRLPYALRFCMVASQHIHVSLEEAAANLGASRASVIRRIVFPLMAGGILAGFVTSFITAAVELSATMLLTSAESQAPMSYGIYLYMQSISGHGPGAALGVVAMVIVGLGTYAARVFVARSGAPVASATVVA